VIVSVSRSMQGGYRVDGPDPDCLLVNGFLDHLRVRGFASATQRAYAYDLVNLLRFCQETGIGLEHLTAVDVFGWIDWQQQSRRPAGTVVRLGRSGAAPATVNRRVAAARGLFEFAVMSGARSANPVPSARRSLGSRVLRRGMLGHLGPGRPRGGGRLVRAAQLLPESLDVPDVQAFLTSLRTHRDRAMVLAMLLGGLRSAEVRGLLLRDVDQGRRQLRVLGKGGKERLVPVDAAFFTEIGAYLRWERPAGLDTAECFVVLRGPTTGQPVTEAGLRSMFRRHRQACGSWRVRPHRLRHTYGTQLAEAGVDLLALRQLMGHADPDTTARYVHLSAEHVAAEYAAARAVLAQDRS